MLIEFGDSEEIDTNVVIAAREKRNGMFFRARIFGSDFDEATESTLFTVFYIDYGHMGVCKLEELRRLVNQELQNLPPRCFECRLAEIQPTVIRSETNDWSPEANDIFRNLIDGANRKVTAEVSPIIMHPIFTHIRLYRTQCFTNLSHVNAICSRRSNR